MTEAKCKTYFSFAMKMEERIKTSEMKVVDWSGSGKKMTGRPAFFSIVHSNLEFIVLHCGISIFQLQQPYGFTIHTTRAPFPYVVSEVFLSASMHSSSNSSSNMGFIILQCAISEFPSTVTTYVFSDLVISASHPLSMK
jgi:hypothetical protein